MLKRRNWIALSCICLVAVTTLNTFAECGPDQALRPFVGGFGGNGGNYFDDRVLIPNLYKEPITKIEIWSGNYIDAVRITYGKNDLSPIHGGDNRAPGGIYHYFNLLPGEYVTQVTGQAGSYVDRLCFITNLKTEAQCFGGDGGRPFHVSNPEGYPLRGLAGRSGRFLDQAQFIFGNFSQIDVNSFKYNQSDLDQALMSAPVRTFDQFYGNNGSGTYMATFQTSKQLTHSESLQLTQTQISGATRSIEANVGFKAGGSGMPEINSGAKYSYSWTTTVTNSSQTSIADQEQTNTGWSLQYSVPPHTDSKITTSWKQLNLAIPVTYDLVYYAGNGQEICRNKIQGTLAGSGASTLTQMFYTTPNGKSTYKLRKTVGNKKPNLQ